jgi:hypothetical protein
MRPIANNIEGCFPNYTRTVMNFVKKNIDKIHIQWSFMYNHEKRIDFIYSNTNPYEFTLTGTDIENITLSSLETIRFDWSDEKYFDYLVWKFNSSTNPIHWCEITMEK